MAVWNSVLYSEIRRRGRIDGEFYAPAKLSLLHKMEVLLGKGKAARLGSLADVEYGYMPMQDYVHEASGEPLLRVTNLKGNLELDLSDLRYVPEGLRIPLKKRLQAGDVLLVQCGDTTGKVGFATEQHAGMLFPSFCLAIRARAAVPPELLALFLESKIGQMQLWQRVTFATVRPNTTKPDVKALLVPTTIRGLEDTVGPVRLTQAKRREATQLYARAQRILEEELGLDKVNLAHRIGYEAPLSELFHARRWDSEFYKPKYQQMIDAILKARKVKVERFVPVGRLVLYLTNGHTPLRHDLSVGEVPFLTAEHVSDFCLDFGTDKRILRLHHQTELARTALRDGDILITIKGKVGNCTVVKNCPEAANINQDVALIRLQKGVHPYFFAAWFNSLMGKQLVEQRSTGGINPFLGLGNLRGMPFPVLAPKEHYRIGDLVQETVENAYVAERQASDLLEQAKYRVEELIEKEVD